MSAFDLVAAKMEETLEEYDRRRLRAVYLDGLGSERRTVEESRWLEEYLGADEDDSAASR